MALGRISDSLSYAFLVERSTRLQVTLRTLQERIASGRRLIDLEDDPLAAAQAARFDASLGALAQYAASSRFGIDVLAAQDDALGEAQQLLVRAEEIATQQATGLVSAAERAAAREEVRGLLQAMTALGNAELAGRRLFGGLALEAPAPFADPETPGYQAATAYSGSTQELSVKIGSDASERVRVSTRGDQVFQSALQALQDLDAALAAPGGDVAGTLAGLAAGRGTLAAERASVGARQAALLGRTTQVEAVEAHERAGRARVVDADLVATVSSLVQTQAALEALLTAGAQIARTSLVNLLRI